MAMLANLHFIRCLCICVSITGIFCRIMLYMGSGQLIVIKYICDTGILLFIIIMKIVNILGIVTMRVVDC